ncbi:hypothetical protein F2Q68_00025331 [Brassica cretica]|uniref:Proteasome endopeptidase complex n=1 Tax=Brassica cretica TaxID=69181 RepID=A0A8S9IGD5_BRACR|nr:hypothetical protein F2Q68_00025331 [Brassica cretica]
MIGVSFEDNHVATGFGNHLARPILRDEWHADLSFEDGVKLLEKCMRVLLYRDRSAINKLQIAKITEEGVTVSQPYSLNTFWEFKAFHNPTAGAEGSCHFQLLGRSNQLVQLVQVSVSSAQLVQDSVSPAHLSIQLIRDSVSPAHLSIQLSVAVKIGHDGIDARKSSEKPNLVQTFKSRADE